MQISMAGQMLTTLSRTTHFNGKIPMATVGAITMIGSMIPFKTSITLVKRSLSVINLEMPSLSSPTNGQTWTVMAGVITKPVSINLTLSHSNLHNGMTSTVMAMAITASLTPMAKKARSGLRVPLSLMIAARNTANLTWKNTDVLTVMQTAVQICMTRAHGIQPSRMVY